MAIQKQGNKMVASKKTDKNAVKATLTNTSRQKMVREAAYYIAEKRAFQPGHELDDWFAAERHIAAILKRSSK